MINGFLFVVFIFMLFMIMKSDINKFVCILFVHLSSISLENFKDRVLIIPEILELIKLHTYKFGLVYIKAISLKSKPRNSFDYKINSKTTYHPHPILHLKWSISLRTVDFTEFRLISNL